MTITLTHEPAVQREIASLENTVAGLIDGPDNPTRLQRAIQLGDPTKLSCKIVRSAVEAFHGVRPIHQLLEWVSPEVYETLSARAQVHASRKVRQRKLAVPGSKVPVQTQASSKIIRTRVVRVSALAAEATVIIHDGVRVRAAALRMEEHRGRWQVTALEIG